MKCHALALPLMTFAALSMSGCADQGDDGPIGEGACTEPGSLCTTLHVPPDYAGTPVKIIVGLFESLPPLGPPNGVAAVVENPVIDPGHPFPLMAENVMPAGSWFLYIALYNEGGGEFQPVAGIDYVVQSSSKVEVGGPAVNMPDMTVSLYQP